MVTPLSKLKFHRGPEVQIDTSNGDCKVSDEVMKMGNYLQQQYGFAYTSILSKQTEFSASSLIPLFITGKYNNIPNLVSILWDIYCQWKLLKLSQSKKTPQSLTLPKNYSFEYFLLCSPLGEDVNFSAKNMKLLVKGMNEYYFNYFWPISRSSISLINDTFSSYFKYAISISQSVNSIISKNSDLCPLHLDFWIIPRCIMSKKSSDSEYFEQEDDILMNIEKRLNLGGIDFTTSSIKNGKDTSSIGISQLLSRKIIQQLKNENNSNNNRRLITIIDRRTSFYDFNEVKEDTNKDNILELNEPVLIECDKNKKIRNVGEKLYFYNVNNKFGEIPKDYIQEKLLYNTQQWLLPFCRIKNGNDKHKQEYDGGTNFTWKNQVFLLSFHINSVNDVKAYWYLNESLMRFVPNNMLDIWPHYFYNHKDNQVKKDIQQLNYKQIQKEWKLKVTDKVFQQYYKELISKDK